MVGIGMARGGGVRFVPCQIGRRGGAGMKWWMFALYMIGLWQLGTWAGTAVKYLIDHYKIVRKVKL